MPRLLGMMAASIAIVGTPAFAQECSTLSGYARQECQSERNQRIEQEHAQDQAELNRSAAANPELARRLEENRIMDEDYACTDKHHAAREYSPNGQFADCEARRKEEEAALNQERSQDYAAQQQAQAQESLVKFHYHGKFYVDPAVIQSISLGIGNYGDVTGNYVVIGMVPITQVDRHGGKYWGYMGSAAVCVSNAPIAIAVNSPVSVSGKVRGTTVTTVSRGDEQAQVNTVVIDDCHVGPPVDQDQLWAQAQRGQ